MTTNVVDNAANILASDSRWSWQVKRGGVHHAWIVVDDAGFDKIEVGSDYSFIFAGPAELMEKWKTWRRHPNRVVLTPPPVADGFALCILNMSDGKPEFEHGQKIVGSDHRFAGTGAHPAYECWKVNRIAIRSVTSAYAEDFLSGGQVKSLDLKTGKHNVSDAISSKEPNKAVLSRGKVMYPIKQDQIPAEEAAKTDPFVKEMLGKVASGSVSAEAPDGNDKTVWTDADKDRLAKALQKCFGVKP